MSLLWLMISLLVFVALIGLAVLAERLLKRWRQ